MISGIVTALLLMLFVGGWIWAWQPRLRKSFDATARLAVDDEVPAGEEITGNDRRENA